MFVIPVVVRLVKAVEIKYQSFDISGKDKVRKQSSKL